MRQVLALKNLAAVAILGVVVVAGATVASALTLNLSASGGFSVSVTDNGAGDINPALGAVTFIGALGPSFSINVTTGLSTPVLPLIQMDLNSVNVNSVGPGTLTISLTDSGFPLAAGSYTLISSIGGTLVGPLGTTLFAEQCIGTSCPGTASAVHQPIFPVAFSDTATVGFITNGSGISITELVMVTFTGPGNVSFDLHSTVPEPSALMLLGTGLVGMAAAPSLSRRWRSRREGK